MIQWKRAKNGIKESEDGRFSIIKNPGDKWHHLKDRLDPIYDMPCYSQNDAKDRAERLLKYHPAPIPVKIYRLIGQRSELAKKMIRANEELNAWLVENGFDLAELPELTIFNDPDMAAKAVRDAIERKFCK